MCLSGWVKKVVGFVGFVDLEFVVLLIFDREREREIGRCECVEVWEFGVVVIWGSVYGRDELRVVL